MTMANVTAGFRVTGICPLNRNVLSLDTSVAKLSQETGLFLPMHSLMSQSKKRVAFDFTDEEIGLFERRFENGYDLTDNKRYNLWLTRYHPESSLQQLPYNSTAVSSFLSYPSPPARAETLKPKPSGKVLTSTENLPLVKEKERQKEEKQRKKEERERNKKEREEAKFRDTMKGSLGKNGYIDSGFNTLV